MIPAINERACPHTVVIVNYSNTGSSLLRLLAVFNCLVLGLKVQELLKTHSFQQGICNAHWMP